MPEDHLADNLDGNTGSGCIGGCIPAQMVRAKRNSDHFPGLRHHHPGSLIGNREHPILTRLAAFSGILPQPVGNLLGNEHHLMLPAELGDYRLIGSQGVFLNGTDDNPSSSWRHRLLLWSTSFSLGLTWVGQRR